MCPVSRLHSLPLLSLFIQLGITTLRAYTAQYTQTGYAKLTICNFLVSALMSLAVRASTIIASPDEFSAAPRALRVHHFLHCSGLEPLDAVLEGYPEFSAVSKRPADAEQVYVYVFGDHVPHLHFNLAPHRAGDGLRGGPGLLDPLSPDVDLAAHQAVATAVRGTLNASS